MSFERYFKITSYALIGSGFAAAAASGGGSPVAAALFAAVFIASFRIDTAALRRRIPAWSPEVLAALYLPFFFVDARFLSRSFVAACVHLLLFAAAIKLLTRSGDRDTAQLYLVGFALLLAASGLTVHIVYGACLLVFVVSGVGALILYEMRRSHSAMEGAAGAQPLVPPKDSRGTGLELFTPFPSGLFFVATLGMAALILAVSVPIFLLLPRAGPGPQRRPAGATQFISGFSDRVELGRIGTIKQSDAVVMRVKIARPPESLTPDLKWRGFAFDRFDGRAWESTARAESPVPTQGRYYKLENLAQGTEWLNQTFFVEALSTDVVFAAHKALAVSQEVGALRRDSNENLRTGEHRHKKLRYSAISDTIRPDPGKISDFIPIPRKILDTCLQLPAADPRIPELAKRAAGTAADRFSKARNVEEYLRRNYGYSLVLRGTPDGRDPLAAFLFDVRSGHCEYFASAMAILLRHLGIPSRLVNGFRAGDYNGIGGNWTVRQYHAHSWVEAYFPPYGWVEFDPTPAEPAHQRSELARFLSDLGETIDLWWWESVLNYDASKQIRLLNSMSGALEALRRGAKGMLENAAERFRRIPSRFAALAGAGSPGKGWIIAASILGAACLLGIWMKRRPVAARIRRAFLGRDAKSAAVGFYAEALELLRSRGLRRVRGQTAMEFAASLGSKPCGGPLLRLTRMYYAYRFGTANTPFDRTEAQTQLRRLRDSLREP